MNEFLIVMIRNSVDTCVRYTKIQYITIINMHDIVIEGTTKYSEYLMNFSHQHSCNAKINSLS